MERKCDNCLLILDIILFDSDNINKNQRKVFCKNCVKNKREINNLEGRVCTHCLNYKDGINFRIRKNKLISTCIECEKQDRRNYYKKNTEKEKELQKTIYYRLKDKIYEQYGGYICKCCGETNILFLSLDHINNDGADHRREISGRRNGSNIAMFHWLIKNNFPPILQVLCHNCNMGKRLNKGICPHEKERV